MIKTIENEPTETDDMELHEPTIYKVAKYGFDPDFIRKCLNVGELNYATTSYFLLQMTDPQF